MGTTLVGKKGKQLTFDPYKFLNEKPLKKYKKMEKPSGYNCPWFVITSERQSAFRD